MAIRTNFLEVDVTSDTGDPVKGDNVGIGATATGGVVPDGKPVEPQIQEPTPMTIKTAGDIASTNGVIPTDIPHDKYDKLATDANTNEGAVKMTLADIIDESKLAAYVYNKLTGKVVTEAPEPTKPGKTLLEAPEPTEPEKTILESTDNNNDGKKDSIDNPKLDADIKKLVKEETAVNTEADDIAKLEEAIDEAYDSHYRAALEQIADHDTDGKMVYEAVKKIKASKDIAKKKLVDQYKQAKAKKDAEDKMPKKVLEKILKGKKKDGNCPKCGKPKDKCECGVPGTVGQAMPTK